MKGDDFRKYYDIQEIDEIGRGSFSFIYKATKKDTNETRAIKLIDIQKYHKDCENCGYYLTEKEKKDFINSLINEINIMQIMEGENHQNKNTVKFYEYYYKENKEIAIVMELCDDNFAHMIRCRNISNQKFTLDEIRHILHQLNNSFKIMFQNKIAHRDLRPLNILVKYEDQKEKNNYILKLCDYGDAKKLTTSKALLSRVVGAYTFMAPEIMLKNKTFDLKCDLWSLGIIIYYLYFEKYPFDIENEIAIIHAIKDDDILSDIDSSNNKDFDDLIRKLLVTNPEERISWQQYFNHPFLNKYDIDNPKNLREIIRNIPKEKIGKGGFGTVYKFQYNGKIYVLKQIELEKLNEKEKNDYEKEAQFLSKFNNEYIAKYYDSFSKDNKFNIIMEYAGNKTLKSYIKDRGDKLIDSKTLNNIIKQICLGLKEIHELNIIHRDISPDNIFIDEKNLKIKIGDFGISTISQYSYSPVGKYKYMAPEMQLEVEDEKKKVRYNKSVDIYALGCVLYELFTLRNYYDDDRWKKIEKINLEFYDEKWQKLIDSMLAIKYHERPSIEEVLSKLD